MQSKYKNMNFNMQKMHI